MKNIMIFLLLLLTAVWSVQAQEFSDTSLFKTDDQKLGIQLLQKSRDQKITGRVLAGITMASGIALCIVSLNNLEHLLESEDVNSGGMIALGSVMLAGTITSIGFISASAKNAGKAEILLRPESTTEPPAHDLDLGIQYYKRAQQQRLTGLVLLGSGISMLVLAPKLNSQDKGDQTSTASQLVTIGGFAATCLSVPLLISAAKNKGRATILLKKESIPFSYYSKPIGLQSVALSVPF